MSNINQKSGEVIRTSFSTIARKNVSVQTVGSEKVIVYDFVNTYEPGPSGTKEDYRVIKKPKKVEEYDIRKVMVERCKGQDLKSMIARVEQTGDPSILMQRKAVFGDGRQYPRNLSDALELGASTDQFLSGLSASDTEKLIKLSKDPKAFEDYVKRHTKSQKKAVVKEEAKPAPAEEKKGAE